MNALTKLLSVMLVLNDVVLFAPAFACPEPASLTAPSTGLTSAENFVPVSLFSESLPRYVKFCKEPKPSPSKTACDELLVESSVVPFADVLVPSDEVDLSTADSANVAVESELNVTLIGEELVSRTLPIV